MKSLSGTLQIEITRKILSTRKIPERALSIPSSLPPHRFTSPFPSLIVTGLIFTPVVNELAFQGPFLKLGQNVGLLIGAVVFGVGSDIWGRKYISFEKFSIS